MAGAIRMIHVYRSNLKGTSDYLMVNSNTASIAELTFNSSFWTSTIISNAITSPEALGAYICTYDEFVQLYPEYFL